MTRPKHLSPLVVAALLGLTATAGCETGTPTPGPDGGTDGTADAGAEAGLPPGTPCVVDLDAGRMVPTYCLDNPALPTCFQCVDLTGNGLLDGVCAFTCRLDEADCPPGQTCTHADSSNRTSYQPCRDLTAGHELGYCR